MSTVVHPGGPDLDEGAVSAVPAAGMRTARHRRTRHLVVGTRVAGVVLLAAGLVLPWVQPVLGAPMTATHLFVVTPTGSQRLVSWGLTLAIAAVLSGAGLTRWGRRHPLVTDLAAVVAGWSVLGFLLQSLLVDFGLQEMLRVGRAELAEVQRLVGYRIPRPTVTTVGPVPLPTDAAEVVSALRIGFYAALLGAVLLLVAAWTAHRRSLRRPADGRALVAVLAVVAAAVLVTVVQGAWVRLDLDRARGAAAQGADPAAVTFYSAALGRASGVGRNPDVLADLGVSELRSGPADGPAAALAASRLELQSGRDLEAMQMIAQAAETWPAESALQTEFRTQALTYLRLHTTTQPVRAVLTGLVDGPVLRLAMAKVDLAVGDNPAAIVDARAAQRLTVDHDVLSTALTLRSVAESRSGDLAEGRRTLVAAVEADTDYVNVMARSLLVGLYTTVPL